MTPAEFRAAVDAYRFTVAAPPHPNASLLIGHGHGLRAAWEPAVFYRLVHDADATALAFEWSDDELRPLVDGIIRSGRLDAEELWRLPETAEAFCGDGRFTAGHVALLERLVTEHRLSQLILFDRLEWAEPERSANMAAQLAREWSREHRLVAVVGRAHVPEFRAHLPELFILELDYNDTVTGTAVVPER